MNTSQLGLCSWSIDRHNVIRGITAADKEFGVPNVQIGFFSSEALRETDADAIRSAAEAAGVTLCGVFVAFEGEDYSSIERIAVTGGLLPNDACETRLALIRRAASLAAKLSCPSIGIHAATIPSDTSSSVYMKLVERVRQAADIAQESGLRLVLETGREPAHVLGEFVTSLDRTNVTIGLDVGNFVIYGTDDPVRSVKTLAKHIDLVHIKDAFQSNAPGVEFGKRAPVGEGDARIARVLSKLRVGGYTGPILLEASASANSQSEIRAALDYLRTMLD